MNKNIVMMKTKDVVPYKNNPRNNDDAVDAVANSIKEFGFQNPIIVDKDNVVIAGHTRLRAAKKLKLTEVPVIVASELTDEQVKAFRLADNKTAELAEWDDNLLSIELNDILNINMEDFGFDIDGLLAENNDDNDTEVEEDEIPEVDEEHEPVAKLGDIWQLGNHRLMCGDSTSEEQVETLTGGGYY